MQHSESSVLLAWVALGEAAPAAALAIVCLLSAAVVAVVLGGLSIAGVESTAGSGLTPHARVALGLLGSAAGAVSLGLMLRNMRVDGAEWYTPVALFSLTMFSFVAAQFSLTTKPGAAERPVAATPKITVRPVATGATTAATNSKKAA